MRKHLFIIIPVVALVVGLVATYGGIYADYRASNPPVHYHANFALFINGSRVDLSAQKYMEDIGSCSVSGIQSPRERVHLHSGIGDTVHVHASQVTWADLLTNLGFYADTDSILTDTGETFATTSTKKVRFVLNGKVVSNPIDSYIASEDRLLISYGDTSDQETVMNQYLSVPTTAHTYNTEQDPATCSGSTARPFKLLFWRQ